MARDFGETLPPLSAEPISMVLTDREVYDIERLAARLTLRSYQPGVRMSMRRAIEAAIEHAGKRENWQLHFRKMQRDDSGTKKPAVFRVSHESKDALRALTVEMGYGWSDTASLLCSVALFHRALDHEDQLKAQKAAERAAEKSAEPAKRSAGAKP